MDVFEHAKSYFERFHQTSGLFVDEQRRVLSLPRIVPLGPCQLLDIYYLSSQNSILFNTGGTNLLMYDNCIICNDKQEKIDVGVGDLVRVQTLNNELSVSLCVNGIFTKIFWQCSVPNNFSVAGLFIIVNGTQHPDDVFSRSLMQPMALYTYFKYKTIINQYDDLAQHTVSERLIHLLNFLDGMSRRQEDVLVSEILQQRATIEPDVAAFWLQSFLAHYMQSPERQPSVQLLNFLAKCALKYYRGVFDGKHCDIHRTKVTQHIKSLHDSGQLNMKTSLQSLKLLDLDILQDIQYTIYFQDGDVQSVYYSFLDNNSQHQLPYKPFYQLIYLRDQYTLHHCQLNNKAFNTELRFYTSELFEPQLGHTAYKAMRKSRFALMHCCRHLQCYDQCIQKFILWDAFKQGAFHNIGLINPGLTGVALLDCDGGFDINTLDYRSWKSDAASEVSQKVKAQLRMVLNVQEVLQIEDGTTLQLDDYTQNPAHDSSPDHWLEQTSSQDVCLICYGPVLVQANRVTLTCGHEVCDQCMKSLDSRCPVCRQPINSFTYRDLEFCEDLELIEREEDEEEYS